MDLAECANTAVPPARCSFHGFVASHTQRDGLRRFAVDLVSIFCGGGGGGGGGGGVVVLCCVVLVLCCGDSGGGCFNCGGRLCRCWSFVSWSESWPFGRVVCVGHRHGLRTWWWWWSWPRSRSALVFAVIVCGVAAAPRRGGRGRVVTGDVVV